MISVRLPRDLENKINYLSETEGITKSDIIKEALEKYLKDKENHIHPYKLGEELFGRFGSGKKDMSSTYKQKVRKKINEKVSY
ncbi:MAG: ribbon-helix-helix protein, CopG family [Bacillota bacterium]